MIYNVPTTGTYYLVVFSNGSSYYNAFSKYRVDFYSTRNNESMEFNSSAGTYNDAWEYATAISLNNTYSCKLDTPYDCDTYNISIPAEGKVTINLDKKGYNDNYSLLIKDLDGQIYEYLNSKSDYVFYAQRAGTYKIAVVRRNLPNPSTINYAITTVFTPKASYDAFEYVKNPNISTPYKNVEFLYSNNQYLKINGMGTNLTDLSSQGTKSISMDNRYDVDWFKIDTAKLGNSQNNGKISLTGISLGDDYNLAVVDTAGNVIGNSNKSSNQNEVLNFRIDKSSNRYYYMGVYANNYGANSHTAKLEVSFNYVADNTNIDKDGDGLDDGVELINLKYHVYDSSTGKWFYECIDNANSNIVGSFIRPHGLSPNYDTLFCDTENIIVANQYENDLYLYKNKISGYLSVLSGSDNEQLRWYIDTFIGFN